MRDVDDEARTRLRHVLSGMHALSFPKMEIAFRGDGYVTAWGPGMDPWFDVLFACEPADLILIERSLDAQLTEDAAAIRWHDCPHCHRRTTDLAWHTWAQHGLGMAPESLPLGPDRTEAAPSYRRRRAEEPR